MPTREDAARIRPGRCTVLATAATAGAGRVFHAFSAMAPSAAPRCEIRTLVLHTYPDGIKAFGHERITTPMGRRGKPVRKLRLIPAERAYAWARKLQGTPGTTVSVL